MFKNHCCGCGACSQVCPKNAITMKPNLQGFLYPSVDRKKCIQCGKCIHYCSFNRNEKKETISAYPSFYALKHNDENVRLNSRSGGAFTALTNRILEENGVVYGCDLINNRVVKHVRVETKSDRDRLRSSKYIQSDITNLFKQIKEDLIAEKKVIFVGTACQVAAVKSYLRSVNTQNLLLIDIVCHGVGSPVFWNDYLNNVEKKFNKKIKKAEFRNKRDLWWKANIETFYFTDEQYNGELFKKYYVSHLIMRNDCASCPYKSMSRTGDITLGDCWGISDAYPEFDDNKGVSLVLINNEKGETFFDQISNISLIKVDFSKLVQQSPLFCNWILPAKYKSFWRYYKNHNFSRTTKKYLNYAESIMFSDERESIIKRILKRCLKVIKKE